jgi:C1A family cysteine protease
MPTRIFGGKSLSMHPCSSIVSACAIWLTVLLLFSQDVGAQQQTPSFPKVESTRPTAAEVEQRIKSLKERRASSGEAFEIGATHLLTFSITELVGGEKGLPARRLLIKRRAFALSALALYHKVKRRLGIENHGLEAHCRPSANAFDWYHKGYVLPPRSQNLGHGIACGACWAFASVAAYESSYLIEIGAHADAKPPAIEASEQRVLNCTPDSDCGLGYVYKALDLLVLSGTIKRSETFGKYVASKFGCPPHNRKLTYHAAAWGPIILDSAEVASPRRIKEALCKFGPVTSRIVVDDDFIIHTGAAPFHQVNPVNVNDPSHGHHVVIVGWDDSKGKNGAWLVKNSWGPTWGMAKEGMPGYAWVEYGANQIGHHANWIQAYHPKISPRRLEPALYRLKRKYYSEYKLN